MLLLLPLGQGYDFPVLFTNVHVFDGVNEDRIENANVLVEGNLIVEVSTEPLMAANARIIDGDGRTLMPGLIDMHWHSAYANIPMQIGLTSDHAYHLLIGAKGNEKTLLRGFTTARVYSRQVLQSARLPATRTFARPPRYPLTQTCLSYTWNASGT